MAKLISWISKHLSLGGLVQHAGEGIGVVTEYGLKGAGKAAAFAARKDPEKAQRIEAGFSAAGETLGSGISKSSGLLGKGVNKVVQKTGAAAGAVAGTVARVGGASPETVATVEKVGNVVGAAGVGLAAGLGLADFAVAMGAAAGTAGAAATTSGLATLGGGSMAAGQAVAGGIAAAGGLAGFASLQEFEASVEAVLATSSIPAQERAALLEVAKSAPESISFISGDSHYSTLLSALRDARASVCILSGWIGSPLLDPNLQEFLRAAMARGVDVYLGFGWESGSGHELSVAARSALAVLHNLRTQIPGRLRLGQFANHEKVLVVDDIYLVVGSNNWLSNRAFRNSERSIKITSVEHAAYERDRLTRIISKAAGAS